MVEKSCILKEYTWIIILSLNLWLIWSQTYFLTKSFLLSYYRLASFAILTGRAVHTGNALGSSVWQDWRCVCRTSKTRLEMLQLIVSWILVWVEHIVRLFPPCVALREQRKKRGVGQCWTKNWHSYLLEFFLDWRNIFLQRVRKTISYWISKLLYTDMEPSLKLVFPISTLRSVAVPSRVSFWACLMMSLILLSSSRLTR